MSDGATVILAIAVWVGALAALPVPRWLAIVCVLVSLVHRRPGLLVVGGFLLACSLSVASWDGLRPPSPASVARDVVLLSDPVEAGHAMRVDVRVGRRRVEGWARGAPAAALADVLAGEVVAIEGRLRPVPDEARSRLAVRHVAARVDILRVGRAHGGSAATRAANALRRLLERGSVSLPRDRRALLSGFLIGDDRLLPAPVESDFRAAGLTHLLAVSGQNLALTLAVAGPLLRRLQLRGRLLVTFGIIGFFAVVTRAEPSVLRASAMAGLASWVAFSGRPASRLRVLALAVVALVLVDPMLPRSVGFQLSVGASLGLVLLAAPIARRVPGPRWLAESIGVTAAAQLGVAPVLTATFGGIPVVTLVANLLAVPATGPLTAWGLTAGMLAGVVGGGAAAMLHVPTSLLVGWIEAVARASAQVPLGLVGTWDVVFAVIAAGGAAIVGRRRLAIAAPLMILVLAAWPRTAALHAEEVARGAHLWRAGAVVLVLDGDVDTARVLDGLTRASVRSIDLVVARRGSKDIAGTILDVRARVAVRAIAAPAANHIRYATAVDDPVSFVLGRLTVRLEPRGSSLEAEVS